MKNILTLLLLLLSIVTHAQQKYTLSGRVQSATDGEDLIRVTILVNELKKGVLTNEYGFYSLTLPSGDYTVSYTYLGYDKKEETVSLNSNKVLNVKLKEKVFQAVIITDESEDENVNSTEMGSHKMDIKQIKLMPAMMGEVDIIKSIETLPGVTTVGEGSGGFNVRGGAIDQNLVLLDEGIIYNSAHLLGFFSVFNPDAVKDVKLVKGGIPSLYGGRLSSLLDVKLKEGNREKFEAAGGIGTISSRFTVEAPISNKKGSFVVSGRRSYADLFLKLSSDEKIKNNILYFYDLTVKANYEINEKNRVFVSGYMGRDVFKFRRRTGFNMNWGNKTTTVRWNHIFNPKLFANFTGVYSLYDYSFGIPSGEKSFEWSSNIISANAKADFNYYLNTNNVLNFGASSIWYTFKPGKIAGGGSVFNTISLQKQYAREFALYVDHEYTVSPKLSLRYGLRGTFYAYVGDGTNYDYVGQKGQRLQPTNEVTYKKGENIANYGNLEPRFSLRYKLNKKVSLKATYNRMSQYVHLISGTTALSPTDVWTPSTKNIKPSNADQVGLGYFHNLKDNMYELSAETYYKTMSNQIDYIDGAELLLNKHIEGELLYGDGRAYGLELFFKKNKGRLKGWVSYTLAKTERKIEGLNNNEWYNSKYDRTHNISIVGIYKLTDKWTFSTNFKYSTGVSTTFPNARYQHDGLVVPHNTKGERSNYRVPAYHRLDFSANLNPRKNKDRRWKANWAFSVYNVYARRNPFSIYFEQNEDNPMQTDATRLAILGTFIPAVTYNFTF